MQPPVHSQRELSATPLPTQRFGTLRLPLASRSMGMNLLAGKGSGKSFAIGRLLALNDLWLGTPCVLFDPVGTTIDHLFSAIRLLAPEARSRLWPRVRYVDVSGLSGRVTPCPFYYRLGSESLYAVAQRPLDLLLKLQPHLATASILGAPALHRIGTNAGMLLAALGCQITEMEDLLYHPERWQNRWKQAAHHNPGELADVARFFDSYVELSERDREQRRLSLMQTLSPFIRDPAMRATFGADHPAINWQEVIDRREAVLLDFRHVHDRERQRFLLWWWFSLFFDFIKDRGAGRHRPVSLYLDELTTFVRSLTVDATSFVQELDALLNVYSRSHRLWVTTAMQEAWQVDERITKSLMGMGTQIIGRQDPASARLITGYLFRYDPQRIRKREPVWLTRLNEPYVVDHTSTEYTEQEQTVLNSHHLMNLGLFQFLVRPAAGEGEIPSRLYRGRIARPQQIQWVPDAVNADTRSRLTQRDGASVETLLQAIQKRQEATQVRVAGNEKAHKAANAILPSGGERDDGHRTRDLQSTEETKKARPRFWSQADEETPHPAQ